MIKNSGFFLISLFLLAISACKKDNISTEEVPISPTTGSRTQFTLDSIYLYAKQIYLWSDALPGYDQFNPRSYTTESADLANFRKELFDITQLKRNPLTGTAYEATAYYGTAKYSSITNKTANSGTQSVVTLEGQGNDYGFAMSSVNNEVWVSYADPGALAWKAGLRRGCQVLTINGAAASPDLISTAMNTSTLSLTALKPDGTVLTLQLSPAGYTAVPVLTSKVISINSINTGYIAYNSFSALSNSQEVLNKSFAEFTSAAITDLIIDLRYNPGGYVQTAQYVANLIAPSALNGKVMYSEHYNELMQGGKATILKKQPYLDENNQPVVYQGRMATMADVDYSVTGNTYTFSKKGGLETLKNIHFIVSGQTGSASELLMNSLKPYFNLSITGTRTYGKPVGFFGITIDQYTVYLSSFLIKNAAGSADYFDGIAVDIAAADDITHDFGDPQEECLRKVLGYIQNGRNTAATVGSSNMGTETKISSTLSRATNSAGSLLSNGQSVKEVPHSGDLTNKQPFPGMIETRFRLKN
ncbi:S41 family peptidase [Pedobacter sp. AW31-3R]|uniref:S41 family peptidase n=1 Tax=Pedobacter sp. AW31-3R TaxID=3445781 RepID=UPI003FA0B9F6